MYVITSLIPQQKDKNNTSESVAFASYISKYNDGFLFNSKLEYVHYEEAANHIDKHSRGGIRKGEAKWYSPTYCLSSEECLHIVSQILEFGTIDSRKISDFDQLTKSEQQKYNSKIQEITLLFQREMAKNFNKSDIGINDEHDIIWYAGIEHVRNFKAYDRQVQNGYKSVGEKKYGFHTHIRILQSRKANNEKKSLISPQANARAKTHQNAGFDRNKFYNNIETTFDLNTNFKRKRERSFEYFKAKKKERISLENTSEKRDNVNHNSKNTYIPSDELKQILSSSNCIQYFNSLVQNGNFILKESRGNRFVFQDKNNPNDVYFVSEKNWYNPNTNLSGGIINAIQGIEKFNWNQSVQKIKYLNSQQFNESQLQYKKSQSSIQYSELRNIKNLLYLKQSKILNINYAKRYLKENHSNNDANIYFKNNSNGYHNLINGSLVGQNDITTITKNDSKEYHLFSSIFDYLKFKEKTNKEINFIVLNKMENINIVDLQFDNRTIINHTSINLDIQKSKSKPKFK